MRSYQEIESTARDQSPFSNSTEWEIWAAHWCWAPCMNPVELAWQRYEEDEGPEPKDFPGGCPLILAAMMGKTPTEWLEQPDDSPDRYHCVEFRSEEGEGDEPQPIPDPPGTDALFPRDWAQRLEPPSIAKLFGVPPELVGVQKVNTSTHEGVPV